MRFSRSDDGVRDAVLINTAGGLAAGDTLRWEVTLGPDAVCRVVSQACEKVYRTPNAQAAALVKVTLTAASGARLEWLPQETILFNRSRLQRSFDIDMAADAQVLAVEAVIVGRRAMGETAIAAELRDRWRVRREGRLIFADNLTIADLPNAVSGHALLDGAGAFASVLLVAPDAEERSAAVRAVLEQQAGTRAACSGFDGKLFCRLLAADGAQLRQGLLATLGALRDNRSLPRHWTL